MLGCSSWEPEKRAGQEVKGRGLCEGRAGLRGRGGGSGGAEEGEAFRGEGLHGMVEVALRGMGTPSV